MAPNGAGYNAWFDMEWEVSQAEISFDRPFNTNVAIDIAYGASMYIGNTYIGNYSDGVYESGMTTGQGGRVVCSNRLARIFIPREHYNEHSGLFARRYVYN
jgi:hypothetical protein